MTPSTERGKTLPQWMLEGVFIVVSVLLGFGVAQFGETRANNELARRALASLRAELEYNLAAVEPYVAFHRATISALEKASAASNNETGYQLLLRVRPEIPRNFNADMPLPRQAAWDAAASSGALRFIDYDLIASLSEIYQMQGILGAASGRMPVSSPAFFDPASRDASVRVALAAVNEIKWAEQTLVALYQKQLAVLRGTE